MLDHYLPTQGPEFETWMDEADSVAARIAADKMFTYAARLSPTRPCPAPQRRRREGGRIRSEEDCSAASRENGKREGRRMPCPCRMGGPPRRWARPLGLAARKRAYFIMMGACLLLIVLAWTLIWRFSVTAAIAMSAVALVVPPLAAIVANSGPVNRQ